MKPVGALLLVLLGATVVGCSTSSDSESLAAVACAIQFTDSGEAVFNGRKPSSDPAHEETQANVDEWKALSQAATQAAAEDARYKDLRDVTLAVYQSKDKAVKTWQETQPSVEAFYQTFDQDDIDAHNQALGAWDVECSVIADQLNQ